ncbi:ATP-dependent DNA helicase RecQ [Granulicella sibirica]|uniref:ATP-dependent DNA helicase RecQ n=2 Tax=Granulicella sibirica TaxID=2479048 RepID=A0A4Q0SZV9_9BACT|nr:ATP-dependent DNA helicase RecQ [Granulicella sibirica]
MTLEQILHETFGFPGFRANQEAVCRAATEGRDVLLVMPTGAGKSLCYQLPAIARGGTALVISPLIALMDDQAAKLTAAGLRVARIHSGLSREDARQACRDYLDGTLQFLFIAPERMRVPGFPEMLAKKKPALIAIDEAHCISAWGHDFRPDYRTLGDYLPSLRPAPIIALTATATPTVQRDIVAQLNLNQPALFIHGFRRENLAIEVVEMSKPRRPEFTVKLLKDKENRPAIVYAPSRKAAEELAGMLGRGASAYHAGLDPQTREEVQTRFLSGKLEIVVATIAFGMGIDKADVRTVIHTALPGSVEAYYQEIGRAGRDGNASRTILLYSFADRKMHDFFLERDYPPPTELSRVASTLTDEFQMPDLLRQRARMDAETFDKAVEKLASQGAAAINIEGNVRGTGSTSWRKGYDEQVNLRRTQIDRMMQFAEAQQCRMTALIRHFGDTADGTRPCGRCDVCAPSATTAQSYRQPDSEDLRQLSAVLRALDGQSRSTGKLYTELSAGALRGTQAAKERKAFEALLDALSRAGLITLNVEQWTNPEGNVVSYKKAALTHEGREAAVDGLVDVPDLLLRDTEASSETKSKGRKADRKSKASQISTPLTPDQKALEARLREWRKAEAAKTGKPAFIVFGDAVLEGIAREAPTTIGALLQISGIGPEKADRYGAAICALCRGEASTSAEYGTPARPAPAPKPARRAYQPVAPELPLSRAIPSSARDDFRRSLIEWRTTWSERAQVGARLILSDEHLDEILRSQPRTIPQLQRILNLSPTHTPKFLIGLQEVCAAASAPQPEAAETIRPARAVAVAAQPVSRFTRAAIAPETETSLTPEQAALDVRLRDWRKAESERLGLPQFFVLSTSTLRSIVLERPRTIAQLQTIPGIGPDKAAKFGTHILAVCHGSSASLTS